MYSEFVRKVLSLYLKARYGNEHPWEYYRELNESQWWSPDEIATLQLKRLNTLLKHAYQNVPYYAQKFREVDLEPDDIKTLDDLPKLPILTRQEIRENLPNLVAKNFPHSKIIPYATGGSTGEPLQFYVTEESKGRGVAASNRAYSWYGYELGDKVAYLWGSPRDLSIQQSLSNKISLLVFRTIYLDAFNMSEKQMEEFAQKLAKFKPEAIIAYASAGYLFAKFLQHREIKNIRPRVVITQAEKLFPQQRQLIEGVFNCEVFDFYGSREVSAMAAECPQHQGYHISAENVILEFVRDNKPVPSGETGKILVTDLHNYAMPFIRHENGDLGIPLVGKCSCGRGLPLMKEVTGRTSDIIIGAGGKKIHGEFFTHLFWDKPWVKQFQAIQDRNRNITIKIVGEQAEESEIEAIRAIIQQEVGSEIKLDILFVDFIDSTKSGKYRFTISEAPLEF